MARRENRIKLSSRNKNIGNSPCAVAGNMAVPGWDEADGAGIKAPSSSSSIGISCRKGFGARARARARVCVCVFFVLARFNGNPVEAEFAESFEGPWPRLLAGSEALPDAFAQTSSLIRLKGWSR